MILHRVKRFVGMVFSAVMIFSLAGFADDAFDKLMSAGKYADAIKYAEDNIPVGNRDAADLGKARTARTRSRISTKRPWPVTWSPSAPARIMKPILARPASTTT